MIPPLGDTDPLAPWLTLSRLEALLRTAVRPDPVRVGWVELLLDRMPQDWRMQIMGDVARTAPLRPAGRESLASHLAALDARAYLWMRSPT